VNINHRNKLTEELSKIGEKRARVSFPNELLWSLIGLFLTILGTFVQAAMTNFPWNWGNQGIQPQPLGVTYQIGAVLLTGCLGGKNAGALSQIAYIVLGLTWLPVFAHGGGMGYLKEPTFGYILGFIPGAWLCGFFAFRVRMRLESLAFSAFCGLGVIHLCGLLYLIGLSSVNPAGSSISLSNLPQSIINYSLLPIPGQLVIVCTVSLIAFVIRHLLFY
jgi:biotin transport system substrate-specific component